MRLIDISTTLGLLAAGGLALACKPSPEATEVPAKPVGRAGEASCRHDLGRCGGHLPGDDSCGAASPGDGPAPASTPTEGNLNDVHLQPGEFAEINLEMSEAAVITAEFTATGGDLAWNVHSHEGERAVIHDQGTSGAGRVQFTATKAGVFSYLWKNDGNAPVTLRTTLQTAGAVKVLSVHQPR